MSETPAEIIARLKRQEEKEVPGAPLRSPKQQMLDASKAAALDANKDRHLRWVTLRDPNKVSSRQMEGYTVLPESEGGKRLGDEMVLMAIPKKQKEQRDAHYAAEHARRLTQHKAEWENLAESISRTLRDKHGINISPEKLMRGETTE